jgi:hypothetical protein
VGRLLDQQQVAPAARARPSAPQRETSHNFARPLRPLRARPAQRHGPRARLARSLLWGGPDRRHAPVCRSIAMTSRVRPLIATLLATATLGAAAPALAHHAFAAEFDADRPLDVKGVVTKAKWVNPHSWLYFDVKNTDGSVTNWGVEFGTPNALANKGLTKEDVKAGSEVRIKGYRSKNGGPYGYSVQLTLADGRTFQTGGAQDSPTQPAAAAAR